VRACVRVCVCVCVCVRVCVCVCFDSTSYVFLCADAEPLRRNISYVDLDRFSSCRRVSHVDLGPVSPVRKPAEAEAGKSRYSSPVVCVKLEFCIGARAIKVLRDSGPTATFCPVGLPRVRVTAVVIMWDWK